MGFFSAQYLVRALEELDDSYFNGPSEILRLLNDGKLPVLDGSNLTNVLAASQYDATVGAGGDYATVAEALADGKKSLIQVGSITEIGNVTFTDTTTIALTPGFNWDVGDNSVVYGSDNIDLVINGAGFSTSIIFSPTTSKPLFDGNGKNGTRIFLDSISYNMMGGTANDCPLYTQEIQNGAIMSGVNIMFCPNQHGYGVHPGPGQIALCIGAIVMLNVTGNGDNCYNCISGVVDIPYMVIVGSFHATEAMIETTGGTLGSIKFLDFGPGDINFKIGGSLSRFTVQNGAGSANIKANSTSAICRDCNLNDGDIDADGNAGFRLDGVVTTGNLTTAGGGTFIACTFNERILNGADDTFIGGRFTTTTDNGNDFADIGVRS